MQNNWQQQQPYGYGGQQQPSYLSSQPTGFPLQPMQTGFPQQQQQRPPVPPMPQTGNYAFLNQPPPSNYGRPQQQQQQQPSFGMQPQMTGFPGGGASGLMAQPTGFAPALGPQQTGFQPLASQQTGFGALASQPTGFQGLTPQQTGMLRAQPTGVHDPRLQTMMQSFMPSNMSQPFSSSGIPQFNASQQQPLTQTFNSLLQNPTVKTPKVPWVLSRQEKKDYDQIFRAWDTQGEGFISGEMAREVFGQSGLPQDVLMKIWNLSDVDNRGKLNLPEFHVAMGLIYRALNGNDIPDQLPEELVPPSMRDIDSTVNFMRDLLKHDSTSRSNTASPAYGSSAYGASSKDAKVYKHDDSAPTSYKPASRHIDRKSVRYAGEDASADIGDIRRELTNTSMMLDKSASERARRSVEDEELEQDIEDLKHRVRRLKEDLEYLGKGRQTEAKAEEQRKAERELLYLMHEKLPELERRQARRDEEKRMDERSESRLRDKRNDRFGRFDARDDDRDDDKGWLRGTYDRDDRKHRDRDYDRNRDYDRRGSRDRSRDRYDHDRRPRTPPAEREAPPAPSAPAPASTSVPPVPPPAPAAQPTKKMTPEERSAFIREQAQRRIQERLRALGVESAPEPAAVDTSVQERLERERKEAEAKAASAEAEQQAREEARRKRLEGAGDKTEAAAPASPALRSALKKPPAPAPRAKAPPPAPTPRTQQAPAAPPAPAAPAAPAEDPEEAEFRRQEEAAERARAERRERLKKLQEEEEEERKKEEALLAARKARSAGASPAASPAPSAESPAAPLPPPPAPAPGGSFNPFIRKQGAAAASPAPATGGFNPFFRPPAASASPAVTPSADSAPPPPPPPPPAPPAPVAAAPAAPAPSPAPPAPFAPRKSAPPSDEDWDVIQEKDQDDSDSDSDDDYANSRGKRANLASALFGGLTSPPGSRPGSAAPTAPPAPKANPGALAKLGGGAPTGGGMSALLSSIQGGAALRKTQTVDKSVVAGAGAVIGDAAPPPHINAVPRPASPAAEETDEDDRASSRANRQSVDWYAGLAADQSHPAASFGEAQSLEPTREEEESVPPSPPAHGTPTIEVSGAEGEAELDEFDTTTSLRVRSLYAYEGQRDVDLSFKEDTVLVAHPAKDADSPWWYGIVVDGGAKGWFPKDYVQELEHVRARALFAYSSGSPQDLPFEEGDELDIVDRSDPDWWRTEQAGVVFNVPASYLEIIDLNKPEAAAHDVQSVERASTASPLPPVPLPPAQAPPDPLLSPMPNRSRSTSFTSELDDDSDADSVLSWWSSDSDASAADAPEVAKDDDARRRREEEREKVLASAGLKIRRPPPGIPQPRRVSRRRPAPAVPPPPADTSAPAPAPEPAPKPAEQALDDAYARYEQYLTESRTRTRADSAARPLPSPVPTPTLPTPPTSPSPSPGAGPTGSGGRFSGLLSRMGVAPRPEPGARAAAPVITRVDAPAPAHEVGATWSSLVDATVLGTMGERERRRQEAIFEFVATEAAYNRDLQLIVEVFYSRMMGILEDKALEVIFANIEDILLFGTGFLSALEQRQKACRLYIDNIGDVLEEHVPELGVYTPYCINQHQAARMLQTLRASNAKLAVELDSIRDNEPAVRGLDLSSFLLEPMQRITRYPLLIRQIIHYTAPEQDLAAVERALGVAEVTVARINEGVRAAEGDERLRELSDDLWVGGEGHLDLTAPTAFQGKRRLIKEGTVFKAKSGRKLGMVLCTDVIVLIESRNLYRMPIPLHEAAVREARDETGFVLKLAHRRAADSVALRAGSARERNEWVVAVQKAAAATREARNEVRASWGQ
ncbi:hypothetical protein Q5752_005838 [Cryptotrichosporon argae]